MTHSLQVTNAVYFGLAISEESPKPEQQHSFEIWEYYLGVKIFFMFYENRTFVKTSYYLLAS